MRILWAPWRKPYLERGAESTACILCQKSREREDRKNLILCRGQHCFVLLNLFPYNNGHLMIAPYRHLDRLTSLHRQELLEMAQLAQGSEKILGTALGAEGFNLGMNLGRVAGAGIADHIHLHMVPRWVGDTNFLPVLGETKVISEDIDSTYQRLIPHFTELLTEALRT
ncbi:MAG: HIT domain-containing protein [candidate division NC10 bacterium]|nr:HIT domain-containing protein [candidate division NC10 bacterium]